jgi:GDP-L-fucose synthase
MSALGKQDRIFVAGHAGLVGSAIVRRLRAAGYANVLVRPRAELDLRSRDDVLAFFRAERPVHVVIAAARVGGIAANIAQPVEFLLDNLKIQNNIFEAVLELRCHRTVLLGSSCIYPREAPQPMPETAYMHGPLEPTNESYAIAKIAGIRLAQALWEEHGLSVLLPMPSNVYGPGDHFELERAHVVSALVRRFVDARDRRDASVTLWGTGNARRELLHSDDLADAIVFLMERYERPDIINVGTGSDVSIRELADLVRCLVGFDGTIEWDPSKPDGMPQKLLDVTRIHELGWRHRIELQVGVRSVIEDYLARRVAA